MNAARIILGHAERLAAKPAILHVQTGVTSYGALLQLANRCANALLARGMQQGDRVGLMLLDSPLACAAFLGVMQAGGVAIPLNPRLNALDYAHIFADSGMRLCISDTSHLSQLHEPARRAQDLALLAAEGATGFSALLDKAGVQFDPVDVPGDASAFWLYSSGTTGRPKGIIHAHANAAQSGKLLREVLGADERTTILSTSKLFFAYALDNAFLGALTIGATTILNADWPEPEVVVDQIARHGPQFLMTVPTLARRMLALGPERLTPLRQLKAVYTGGERVPEALARGWLDAVGVELHECYGTSESYLNALANPPGRNRYGSCGVALPGVETRLLDRDGQPVSAGEMGVLWMHHPALAQGYTNAATTAQAFRDGWFCTNDLFSVDRDGYFFHHGRNDELLRVAGQWVKPGAVEEAVLGEAGIREAACAVVPDDQGFERLALFVVPDAIDPAAARATAERACAAKLPRHSQPRWVRVIDELPRTATGKVQRFRLSETLRGELNARR